MKVYEIVKVTGKDEKCMQIFKKETVTWGVGIFMLMFCAVVFKDGCMNMSFV